VAAFRFKRKYALATRFGAGRYRSVFPNRRTLISIQSMTAKSPLRRQAMLQNAGIAIAICQMLQRSAA
jgi:hypothetical protein